MNAPLIDAFAEIAKPRSIGLVYCDYIAARIREALSGPDPENIIETVSRVQWDLHPQGGYMVSTKKTIEVGDRGGRHYRITVEEIV